MTKPKQTKSPLAKARFAHTHAKLDDQISGVEAVLEMCKTSPSIELPDAYVDRLTQLTQDLAATAASVANLKKELSALLSVRTDKELAFRRGLLTFVSHINTLAQGDPTVIRSAGLEAQQRAPNRLAATALMMTKLLGVIATPGVKPGEVRLKWLRVKGARSYAIEVSRTPATGFTHVAVSPLTRMVLAGQPSATPLWYRVAAVAPLGQGPFSDDIAVVAR